MKKKNKTLNQVLAWGKVFQVSLRQDLVLFAMVLILLLFGSAMILSASVGMTDGSMQIVIKTFIKQIIFIVGSLVLYNLSSNLFSIASLGKKPLYKAALLAMGGVLLATGILAPEINGARAWIDLKFMTLQPSEFAKIFLIVGFAASVYAYQKRKQKQAGKGLVSLFDYLTVPVLALVGYFFIIAAVQDDLGSSIIILVIGSILLLLPRDFSIAPYQKMIRWGYLFGFGALLLYFVFPDIVVKIIEHSPLSAYQQARFISALNPMHDPLMSSYQLLNSLFAFTSGGIMGLGYGNSIQKYGYLPEANTDYILAIVAEELGIIGVLVIVVCYMILIHRLMSWALKTQRIEEKIILIGVASYLFLHFFLNVGGVIGLIPLTGVPLLFISAGGSSLLSIMMGMGICQSIIMDIKKRSAASIRNEVSEDARNSRRVSV